MEIKKLGRYEIDGVIGQGAMGIVYKGVDPKIGRVVALKTLHPGAELPASQMEEFKQRFAREAQSAGRLTHPNIVTIYDVGEEGAIAYIAMEFLEGQSLEEMILKRQPLSIETIIRIMTDLCSGLAYAHKNGIIHRDIKPANLIITNDGTAKITDFGIAKIVSTSATQTGMIVGTPSYMSPEQITGRPVDARSDIFSLGAVLYELLTYEKAFPGDNITTVMYRVVNENPAPVSAVNMSVPAPFAEIVRKALQKNPNDRYPDAESMLRDLQAVQASATPAGTVILGGDYAKTMVMSPDAVQNFQTGVSAPAVSQRPKWPWIAVGALAALALILGGIFFFKPSDSSNAISAGTASLQLTLNIPEARILLDTAQYPLTGGNRTITGIRATEHEVAVLQDGYQDFRTRLVFAENETKTLSIEMKLLPFRFPEGVDTAFITIDAQPPGTRVETGTGQFVGFTPITRHPFPAGQHTLVFSKPLYMNQVREITLKKHQEIKLTPTLDYKKGFAKSTGVQPADVRLFLGGVEYKPILKTVNLYQLPLGEHTVILKKDGYKPLESRITVNEKDTARIEGQLEQLYGSLSITSDPSGAEVFINGLSRGYTPLTLDSISAGSAEIRVQKSGMVSKKKTTIRENTLNTLSFKLEAQTGTLRFLIYPWANIWIGNKPIGASPPLEEYELKAGSHDIRIENPAFKPVQKKITLKAGETQTIRHEFK